MTPDRATRRKRRRIRLAIRRTSALAAAIAFFFAWGTIGAIETDAVSLVEGTVRTFGLLFIGTGFAFVGGAFRNPTERRSNMKYTATLSAVQVGQAVKSLLLLGERKITIEETEKDRFVVTTTTETALSKKSTNSISRKGVKNNG